MHAGKTEAIVSKKKSEAINYGVFYLYELLYRLEQA
jgi:hypothetical protein